MYILKRKRTSVLNQKNPDIKYIKAPKSTYIKYVHDVLFFIVLQEGNVLRYYEPKNPDIKYIKART